MNLCGYEFNKNLDVTIAICEYLCLRQIDTKETPFFNPWDQNLQKCHMREKERERGRKLIIINPLKSKLNDDTECGSFKRK